MASRRRRSAYSGKGLTRGELSTFCARTKSHDQRCIALSDPMKIRCFAKINLTLDVFSKRADGYHSLATVMQSIALHDLLTLLPSEASGIRFTCEAPDQIEVPTDSSNLVFRAAQLLWERAEQKGCASSGGLSLHLQKRVPSQA